MNLQSGPRLCTYNDVSGPHHLADGNLKGESVGTPLYSNIPFACIYRKALQSKRNIILRFLCCMLIILRPKQKKNLFPPLWHMNW